ncbi:hypothetical protein [Sinorhizobium sp. BJ1]|uniref:hypothetical protein n=1 Tax=Sinorhizobium sp. BJ1 TaxID=2035455 RepID=UPI001185D9EE|nr:hypothetical protein [Sinorhizobium sp. BJ1]
MIARSSRITGRGGYARSRKGGGAAINIDKALEFPLLEEGEDETAHREQVKREVMLFMDQANRGPGKERGRKGDRGITPDIHDKPLPVYFRKSFQNLKSQMTREVNPLTSAFVVDVHVQYIRDEPRGLRRDGYSSSHPS